MAFETYVKGNVILKPGGTTVNPRIQGQDTTRYTTEETSVFVETFGFVRSRVQFLGI